MSSRAESQLFVINIVFSLMRSIPMFDAKTKSIQSQPPMGTVSFQEDLFSYRRPTTTAKKEQQGPAIDSLASVRPKVSL